jgi:putative transposase
MRKISYARHRFSPDIIQHAVWLYFRFPLSYRDVEDLLSDRSIDVSYETARRWALKFGRGAATRLRRFRSRSDTRWDLDEVFVSINCGRMVLWWAVDCKGAPDIGHRPSRTGPLIR